MKKIYDVTINEKILDAAWMLDETIAACAIEDADIAEHIPMECIAHKKLDGNIIIVHGEFPVSAEVELDENGMIACWDMWVEGEQVEMED